MTDDRRDDYDSTLHAQGWRMVDGKLTHPAAVAAHRALQTPTLKFGSYVPSATDLRRLAALRQGGREHQAQRILLRRIETGMA